MICWMNWENKKNTVKDLLNICILMSSILTSIQIYSEGFFILQVRQKYMNAVLFIRQKSVNTVLYVRQYLHMIR